MFKAQNVRLSFSGKPLFHPFNLTIENGEICLLQSKSGTGKTSFLKWIAGIPDAEMVSEGRIFLNEKDISFLPAEKRQIGILFSEPLLFPHLTVAENVGIGITSSLQGKKRKNLIEKSLIRAKLPGIEKKDPVTLSSGQQTRIALIRTLLSEPSMLLLDEPFSNLDNDIRESMVNYVLEEIKNLNIPVLIVSHDPRDRELSNNKPVSFRIFSD